VSKRTRGLRSAVGRAWGEDVRYEPHPSLYVTLTVKYSFLALYGVLTAVFGITTVEVTLGRAWSVGIPAIIILASAASIVGVQVSRRYRERLPSRHPLPERVLLIEIIAEYVLILSLFAYSVSIIVRTHTDGDWERLAYAVLPMAVTVVPFYRALHLSEREEVPKPEENT
jgi:hypothetical protein